MARIFHENYFFVSLYNCNVCEVINSVFICGCYKWNLDGIARELNAWRNVTGHWLVTVTVDIVSKMHCRKSIEQWSGSLVDQVPALQANWRVSILPLVSARLIKASNLNTLCVRSHENVSSWSMWPCDQQVHRKRPSVLRETPTVAEHVEKSLMLFGA